jgi:hypothetical protein
MDTSISDTAANVDMVLVLSSELVCQIAEKYFNATMLKKKVKVIDLQATSNGLVQFNVAFVAEAPPTVAMIDTPRSGAIPREPNGTFKKMKPSSA